MGIAASSAQRGRRLAQLLAERGAWLQQAAREGSQGQQVPLARDPPHRAAPAPSPHTEMAFLFFGDFFLTEVYGYMQIRSLNDLHKMFAHQRLSVPNSPPPEGSNPTRLALSHGPADTRAHTRLPAARPARSRVPGWPRSRALPRAACAGRGRAAGAGRLPGHPHALHALVYHRLPPQACACAQRAPSARQVCAAPAARAPSYLPRARRGPGVPTGQAATWLAAARSHTPPATQAAPTHTHTHRSPRHTPLCPWPGTHRVARAPRTGAGRAAGTPCPSRDSVPARP